MCPLAGCGVRQSTMPRLRSYRDGLFTAVTLGIGAAVTLVPAYLSDRDFDREFPDQADDQGWVTGGLSLLLPYVLLSFLGRRARWQVSYSALAALLGLEAFAYFTVAGSADAQAALVYLITWPIQLAVVGLTTLPWFSKDRRRSSM